MNLQPNSEITKKIDAISQIITDDLLEYVQKESETADQTFIIAGVIANLCGWYTNVLDEISPPLNDIFHRMIVNSVKLYQENK